MEGTNIRVTKSSYWEHFLTPSNKKKCCVAVVTAVALLVIAVLVIAAIYLAKGQSQNIFSHKAIVVGGIVGATLLLLGLSALVICRHRRESSHQVLRLPEIKNEEPQIKIEEKKISLRQLAHVEETHPLKKVVNTVTDDLKIGDLNSCLKDIYGEEPWFDITTRWENGLPRCDLFNQQLTILLSSDEQILSLRFDKIQNYSPEEREALLFRLSPMNEEEKEEKIRKAFHSTRWPIDSLGRFRDLLSDRLIELHRMDVSKFAFITRAQVWALFYYQKVESVLSSILPTHTEGERHYTATILQNLPLNLITDNLQHFSSTQLRLRYYLSTDPLTYDFWTALKKDTQKFGEVLGLSEEKKARTQVLLHSINVKILPELINQLSAEHIRCLNDKQLKNPAVLLMLGIDKEKSKAVFSQDERSKEIWNLLDEVEKGYFFFLTSGVDNKN